MTSISTPLAGFKHNISLYLQMRKATLKNLTMKPADVNRFNTQSDMISRTLINELECSDPEWFKALAEAATMAANLLESQKGRSN